MLVAAIWAGKLALRTLRTQTTQIKIGRSALNASRKAAQAAADAAITAERALMLSHRAVVHIARFKFHAFGAKHPEIEITLMNSGTLGATLVSGRIGYVLDHMPNVPEPSSFVALSLSAIIPPNVTAEPIILPVFRDDDAVWDQQRWKDVLHGQTRVSIYGSITYDTDLLNVRGETGFGFEFDPGMNRQGDYASRFAATVAPGYNYTK